MKRKTAAEGSIRARAIQLSKKLSKRNERKVLEKMMQDRAFVLRCMTGRGWTREQLMNDKEWKQLNDKLESLK